VAAASATAARRVSQEDTPVQTGVSTVRPLGVVAGQEPGRLGRRADAGLQYVPASTSSNACRRRDQRHGSAVRPGQDQVRFRVPLPTTPVRSRLQSHPARRRLSLRHQYGRGDRACPGTRTVDGAPTAPALRDRRPTSCASWPRRTARHWQPRRPPRARAGHFYERPSTRITPARKSSEARLFTLGPGKHSMDARSPGRANERKET
jgi:hypothetical protein